MTTEMLSEPLNTAPDERANRVFQMPDKEFQKLMNERIFGGSSSVRHVAPTLSVRLRIPK